MYYIQLLLSFIIISAFLTGAFLFLNGVFNSIKYKVPHVGTFPSDFEVMRENLGKYKLKGKKLADLGSGTGKVLRFLEREYEMHTTGYEIDLANVILSKIYNRIFGYNAKIIRGNYLKKDLSEYDVIYVYLFPVLMNDIQEKLWNNCKKGTLIISNAFKFSEKEPIEIFYDERGVEEMFIYEIQ